MKDFKRIPLGRCLNEYQHPLYSTLIEECDSFFVTQSIMQYPTGKPIDVPRCGPNEFLYGVLKESGTRVLLRYVVDSSD